MTETILFIVVLADVIVFSSIIGYLRGKTILKKIKVKIR